jgi:death-on-curing protein
VRFLSIENVIELHDDTIAHEGGSHGIRDIGLLESALSMPKVMFGGEYLHQSIPAMAAAYLFHISQAHAFVDGNKRTALAAAFVFLDVNGHDLKATARDLYDFCMATASGQVTKEQAVAWMAEHVSERRT